MEFHFDSKQFCFVFIQLLVPFSVYWHIRKHWKRSKKCAKIDRNAPVLLPIYYYVIYVNITYIIAQFIVFGFIYDHLSYGKLSPENPIHFDHIFTAILFTGTSHSAVVFAVVLMISFQTSPSAGKYALRRSFYEAFKYSLAYAILDIIPGTFLYKDITMYWLVKTAASCVIIIYLSTILNYMKKVNNPRWSIWLYAAIYAQLVVWVPYFFMAFFAALRILPDFFMTIVYFIAFMIYAFISPTLFYKSLIADSRYWRNLEKYLLPSESFSLSSNLLDNDSLDSVALCGRSKGHIRDTLSNFKINLIDFTQLETTFSILGHGANAVVYKAIYQQENVAVKELHGDQISLDTIKEFCREAYLVSQFEHDNILQFHGVCVAPPQFLMVFEWCNEGELGDFLLKGVCLTSEVRLDMATQAARGLWFFHERDLVHRDLKPSNYLVHMVDGEPCVKLADFGSCRSKHDKIPLLAGISPMFTAPEIRQYIDFKDRKRLAEIRNQPTMHMYDTSTDMFSFGWVLWAILIEENWKINLQCNLNRIMDGWLPEMVKFSEKLRNIIKQCWKMKPTDRASIDTIHEDLWKLKVHASKKSFSPKFSHASTASDLWAEDHPTI